MSTVHRHGMYIFLVDRECASSRQIDIPESHSGCMQTSAVLGDYMPIPAMQAHAMLPIVIFRMCTHPPLAVPGPCASHTSHASWPLAANARHAPVSLHAQPPCDAWSVLLDEHVAFEWQHGRPAIAPAQVRHALLHHTPASGKPPLSSSSPGKYCARSLSSGQVCP